MMDLDMLSETFLMIHSNLDLPVSEREHLNILTTIVYDLQASASLYTYVIG